MTNLDDVASLSTHHRLLRRCQSGDVRTPRKRSQGTCTWGWVIMHRDREVHQIMQQSAEPSILPCGDHRQRKPHTAALSLHQFSE